MILAEQRQLNLISTISSKPPQAWPTRTKLVETNTNLILHLDFG